ncbi:acyltransferase family protein [Microlunatus sp. Y2014]|uniref:acyltransferase family protein n=1 Tax=Microlunatus sp. Y2014 TaxID=3418488 RepID=UPI003DA6DB72
MTSPAPAATHAAPSPARATAPRVRLHGLDALRAGALGLGIVLHAIMPFAAGLPWLVSDVNQTDVVWIGIYWIHLFRMTLFMMLAGYFGRMVVQRRGQPSYVKDRLLRITAPLVGFWPIAVASLVVLATLNSILRDVTAPAPPPGMTEVPPVLLLFSPGHLWFLLVLTEVVLIMVLARTVLIKVLGAERSAVLAERIGGVLSAPFAVVLLAVPYFVAMLVQGDSTQGIIAPQTIIPAPGALVGYGGAFLAGWFLHARKDALQRIARQWPVQLGVAVVLAVIGLLTSPVMIGLVAHSAVIALAGWAWVLALTGLCVRFLGQERPWVRYLADSSYWAYLLHLPLLVGFELLIADQPWPILVKLLLTGAVVGAVLLLSYDLFVRSTWIGKWLNGHRRPRALFRRR